MIHEGKSFSCTCDNCGVQFSDFHSDFSLFISNGDCLESMDNNEWYTGDTDPDHKDKHYCPNCFKRDEDIDDKIIVDTSRTKELPTTPQADSSHATRSNK